MQWLSDHGCEWIKVCAEPGDLLLWDSRTPHYNLSSTTSQPRFCVYTCYMPVADASKEDLIRKKKAFEGKLLAASMILFTTNKTADRVGTTHWPNARHSGSNIAMRDGKPDPHNRGRPRQEPRLDERGWKLTGIPYLAGMV